MAWKNKEYERAYMKAWRAAHRDKLNVSLTEWKRNYRRSHGIKERKVGYVPDPVRIKLSGYKTHAKQRGLVWALSDEQAIRLFHSDCYYCGQQPAPLNGIDRYDNESGYTTENARPCCEMCNYAKRTNTAEAFFAWIARAAAHLENRDDS